MKDICIIIPTIRDFRILRNYIDNAKKNNFDINRLHVLFVTEDFCDKTAMEELFAECGVSGDVFNEADRARWFKEKGLEKYSDVIPRRSHAETSFGLLWMLGNKNFEYGMFIDDDTLPHEKFDFFGTHMKNLLFDGEMAEISSDKNWVNVLFQNFQNHKLYPRGYPYSCANEKISEENTRVRDVSVSQGLWTNVPDLDAVRILMDGDLNGQSKTRLTESDYTGNFSVKYGNQLTVCSMNLAFRRHVIPAFYQLPMDDNPWKIGRFDDIWSGIILKKVCDILGRKIMSGYPLCIHNKAPRSTFKDIKSEIPGIEISEYFYKIIDETRSNSKTFFDVYRDITDNLLKKDLKEPGFDFVRFVAEKMDRWLRCVEKIGGKP